LNYLIIISGQYRHTVTFVSDTRAPSVPSCIWLHRAYRSVTVFWVLFLFLYRFTVYIESPPPKSSSRNQSLHCVIYTTPYYNTSTLSWFPSPSAAPSTGADSTLPSVLVWRAAGYSSIRSSSSAAFIASHRPTKNNNLRPCPDDDRTTHVYHTAYPFLRIASHCLFFSYIPPTPFRSPTHPFAAFLVRRTVALFTTLLPAPTSHHLRLHVSPHPTSVILFSPTTTGLLSLLFKLFLNCVYLLRIVPPPHTLT